ncbi:hypothetical protein U9M48_006324 [Paspalum notatum var. saurae]|uniref:Uncharacterized protein n=1 Tax=Paspalum notatum var. saurae TaxID=547442 RepID=A0AAQ3SKK5_PASNO
MRSATTTRRCDRALRLRDATTPKAAGVGREREPCVVVVGLGRERREHGGLLRRWGESNLQTPYTLQRDLPAPSDPGAGGGRPASTASPREPQCLPQHLFRIDDPFGTKVLQAFAVFVRGRQPVSETGRTVVAASEEEERMENIWVVAEQSAFASTGRPTAPGAGSGSSSIVRRGGSDGN